MNPPPPQNDSISIAVALDRVRTFVTQVTGQAPSDLEVADALGRYFVLKEIEIGGGLHDLRPLTPPGIRVRTRRFR